jgi:hypothetical protein
MEEALFNEALATALEEPDIAAAIETLAGNADPATITWKLEQAVRGNAAEIELAAREEQARLEACEAELAAALDRAIAQEIARYPHRSLPHARLSALAAEDAGRAPKRRPRLRRRPKELAERLADDLARAPTDAHRRNVLDRIEMEIRRIEGNARDEVLERPSRWPEVAAAQVEVAAARAAVRRSLRQRGVLPFCRGWLNQRLKDHDERRLSLTLEATSAPGLSELPNPEHEVPTPDGRHLTRLLGQLPGGSIGVSGPRGSGKTTLLRAFHQGRRRIGGRAPGLGAMVAAPVEYLPRDFVLHLFERLCLAAGAEPDPAPPPPLDTERARRVSVVGYAVAILGFAGAVAGAVLLIEEAQAEGLSRTDQLTLLATGLLVGVYVLSARPAIRSRGGVLAVAVVAAAIAIVFVDDAPGWPDWLWILIGVGWLGAHVAVAAVQSREFLVPYEASTFVQVVCFEAGAIALAGVLGVDIGDRALAGGAVLLAGTAVAGTAAGVDPFERLMPGWGWWPGRLLDSAVFLAGALAQTVGLALLAFDLEASDELVLGLALLGGGLWWIELSRRYHRHVSAETAGATSPDETTVVAESAPERDRPAAPVEALEEVLRNLAASLNEPGYGVRENIENARALLRRWRVAGGELDQTELDERLNAVFQGVDLDSEFRDPIIQARRELERRKERRNAWRIAATSRLRRIQYQQTLSSTWSGRIGVTKPLVAEASRGGGATSAELPLTLPQIVGELRDFLTVIAAEEPVIVAIDELDKMASVEAAERFLNEIKAIFGVSNCYFLVSVSEEAVASFERRGLPFRDVVDSSFDEVLRVGYLSLEDADALLAKRVLLLPLPFVALCHALSGGLARDLIRTARALFDLREARGSAELGFLARELVRIELKAKRDGTVTAIRSLADTLDVTQLLCWLAAAPIDDVSIAPLVDRPAPAAGPDATPALQRLLHEFVGYWYFCVTLVDVFDHLTFEQLQAERGRGLDAFAGARQSFTIDPALAWAQVSAIRETWGLDALKENGVAALPQRVV